MAADRDRDELAGYVRAWEQAAADFVALARTVSEDDAARRTDLPGWTVHDVIAHTAHLEAVLAGAPEETVDVPDAPHLRGPMNRYTEQGVVARRGHDVTRLVEEIERAVATRAAELAARPPADPAAPPTRTFAGLRWDTRTLLRNRPTDLWMHEQDIRRALGRPGGMDSVGARHTLTVFAGALPMVMGKRVAPPPGTTLLVEITDAGISAALRVGADGRAAPCDPAEAATRIGLSAEDFAILAGGRRSPETVHPWISGDAHLARQVLASLTVTP